MNFNKLRVLFIEHLRIYSFWCTSSNMPKIAKGHMSKKLLACSVVPICLLLTLLGIRLPNPVGLQPPHPRPRAVIETTSKSSQYATSQIVVAVEPSDNAPKLQTPKAYRSRYLRETYPFSSTTPPQRGARAPPFRNC